MKQLFVCATMIISFSLNTKYLILRIYKKTMDTLFTPRMHE